MAYQQMFFVQVFGIDSKNRLVGGRSYSVGSEDEAKAKAKFLSERAIGVVAFSQMVDKDGGDAEDPVLLARYGRVPAEARAAA